MLTKIGWLFRSFASSLNPRKWGVIQETFRSTKYDAAFTPSWSQGGEDIALDAILTSQVVTGFYLDIGAHDPNRFSVTRKLYQSGWHGINIDGNSSYEKKFTKKRPRDQFINCCVGFKDIYEFSIFDEGAISTINKEWEDKFTSLGNQVKRVEYVEGKKLREILDFPGVPRKIDFVNIDIEGADEEALRSIEFESLPVDRFPNWILLETAPPISAALDFPAVKYALEFGYTPWLVLPMATLLKAPENNP